MHQLPVREHGFEGEHVMHGESVFQAVCAARVFGDVSTNRTDLLTRWIRRVVIAVRRNAVRDVEVGHAWLHRDATILDVHLEHAIEPRQRDHHAARHREGAAGKARTVTSCDEGYALAAAEADDRLHLRGRRGKHDERR